MQQVAHVEVPTHTNDNNTKKQHRIDWLLFRIQCHQRHIENMLKLVKGEKNSKTRARIAMEIGYARIEIDDFLRPELEELQS